MSTISFVALQCYECLTMQVKQKKKSSNKWNCVVCNEKQSVRKVFYEAFLAKDVRLFVQDFNMSRQFNDQNHKQTLIEAAIGNYENESSQGNGNGCLGKRRNDWSEYLEPEIETSEDGQDKGCESEPEFVTELPKEIFKRPKLKNHSLGLRRSGAVKSSNPVSSSEKRGIPIRTKGTSKLCSNEVTYKDIFEKNVSKPKMTFQTETTNLRSNKVTCNEVFQKNKPEITFQAETAKGASKWAEYLTDEEEDNDYLFKGRDEKSTENPFQNWRENLLEMQFNDQKVEEDLHPDFY
ncbi:hypothetical protein MKW98_023140 [Papaver atlanticum]|uniref:MRN complex-interacting protein N-terminal domain-containing protein n=1 Tax=Papaver atlanticum TaxID=357466 RepID=A0AAD4XTC6_9MAGN|nr:hypothetical protein MKW98_023140 [Papaver atlanticum]